jgi:multisubunit Na+/H+ antiporter MnhB subunit
MTFRARLQSFVLPPCWWLPVQRSPPSSSRHDLIAVIALGASALATALFMVLEPAPDVALVQFVVDVLTTVILVLALTRLPRLQRRHADALTMEQSPWNWIRDAGVALAAGAVVPC